MKKFMSVFLGIFMMYSCTNMLPCGGSQSTPTGGGGTSDGGVASRGF